MVRVFPRRGCRLAMGLLVCVGLILSGCASVGRDRPGEAVPPVATPSGPLPGQPGVGPGQDSTLIMAAFSSARIGDTLPGQWQPFLLTPTKKKTRWRIERPRPWDAALDRGPGMARKWLLPVDLAKVEPDPKVPAERAEIRRVADTTGPVPVSAPALALRGDAEQSASGIAHPVGRLIAPAERLQWDWRIDLPPSDADPGDRTREDTAMRVALSFAGDRSRMPARELMLSDLSQAITGHEIPYATLVYVWAPERELGEIVMDPRTSRVRSIVVANQTTPLRVWLRTQRDVVADFEAVFGEPPGPLKGVALFVDADHTESRAIGWFGDLTLR